MTIEFVRGDLFESGCEALVNPTNCVGIMGAGLALQFKHKYPDYFHEYQNICRQGLLKLGGTWPYFGFANRKLKTLIISCATKGHWRENSQLWVIEKGLKSLIELVETEHIKSVAVPALGAGLGGLDFEQVRPLMVAAFERLPDVKWMIYEPLEK